MSLYLPVVLIVVGAYLLGGIPFGYLIGRMKGVDIRQHGSGNIGATNVLRTFGKPLGITCFALDFLKGLLPVLATAAIGRAASVDGAAPPYASPHLPLIVVFATVAGHIWTPYLRFKGGKGIATSAGAVMGVAPLPVLIAFTAWGLTLAVSRYVGLASVAASITLPLSAILLHLVLPASHPIPVIIVLLLLGTLATLRHRGNIQRILAGTEPKIGSKKNAPPATEGVATPAPATAGATKAPEPGDLAETHEDLGRTTMPDRAYATPPKPPRAPQPGDRAETHEDLGKTTMPDPAQPDRR